MRYRGVIIAGAFLLWLVAVGGGLAELYRYKAAPGQAAGAPARWPDGTALQTRSGLSTLVLLAHPRCPCTASTMQELARLMVQCRQKITAYVVFVRPDGASGPEWENTPLWRQAEAIPGLRIVSDDGTEAVRFRAETSGQVVLYDPSGQLVFAGGVTSARGHAGDNAGEDAIVSFVRNGHLSRRRTPVYGCPLRTPSDMLGTSSAAGKEWSACRN